MAISEHPSAVTGEPPAGLAGLWRGLRDSARQLKVTSLAIALALEALIILLLLTLGTQFAGEEDGKEVTTMTAIEFAAPPEPEPEQAEEEASAAAPAEDTPPTPDQPLPQPEAPRRSPLAMNPQPTPEQAPAQQQAEPQPEPKPSPSPKIGAWIRPGRSYGPVDTGNPRTAGDSERVGTAPNGEPLYAARWYREPTDQELAGYLSTANGPGSALIACKTVVDYYVEDCVLLSETPPGSQMGRAVMAAAWQFRVRPARIGGREQFGSWVRIRIDYTRRQAPR